MKFLGGLDRYLLAALTTVAVVMLALSVVINFGNIVGRYLLHAPIEWAEEAMLYLMIAFVFLGGARIASDGTHIRMDVFVRLMPERARLIVQWLTDVLMVLAGLVLAAYAVPTVRQLHDFDQLSVAAEIPMYLPHAVIPLGLLAMAVVTVLRLVSGRWRDTSGGSH
ncbi:MAG: tripartite ATP-independent periplasmic transporter DctQ [Hyphomicrobiales bacterium]|nr:tripartite ATP-independent periplasmic transporter DctQ [Hyphomicrobiales bacterium]